ncbi:GNAT family N-acetyltransferase [Streptomyces sp. NPDC004111]|uniref:GNAT family N-acetyltransferase n=1 Tax=Streptomyces sp. NPDC004111 TaxID=3364690 RepID=UPI003681D966
MPMPLAELPVRRLTLRDLAACADLSEERGWPRTERKWGLLLTAGTGYGIDDPDAPEGKRLIATCTLTSYGTGAPHDPSYAVLGMLLVAARHERQGLGRRMAQHALAAAGSAQVSLYATASGEGLYRRLGFTAAGRADTFRGHFRPSGPPPTIATRPVTPDDLPAIIRLDTETFGHDRTAVIARLPALADRFRVAEGQDGLLGYAAAWPDRDADTVGPLVARDTETAKALLASLATGAGHPLRLDVDTQHTELGDWLSTQGLTRTASSTTMSYGAPVLPGDPHRRFAPLATATG